MAVSVPDHKGKGTSLEGEKRGTCSNGYGGAGGVESCSVYRIMR